MKGPQKGESHKKIVKKWIRIRNQNECQVFVFGAVRGIVCEYFISVGRYVSYVRHTVLCTTYDIYIFNVYINICIMLCECGWLNCTRFFKRNENKNKNHEQHFSVSVNFYFRFHCLFRFFLFDLHFILSLCMHWYIWDIAHRIGFFFHPNAKCMEIKEKNSFLISTNVFIWPSKYHITLFLSQMHT